ncbi:probable nucleoredoxin 1 [Cynara cardunculus var. scolymus]|uniref:probable nucleoredoxin 1 n=1 Tax=Cynara cardunculus var. scolymus TaxID=59895 RepID=UPI000D62E69A|nr:probable nucleoredoxin 1 [Cynara cardunculus var. scolymus]
MAENGEVDVHDVRSLFSSSERDYLVRNNGDQVAIATLQGKRLGLYFSASWCPPCQRFTPNLVDVYDELVAKGDFEVIFVSADEDVESFNGYFSKMPWLAVPFTDSKTREALDGRFKVKGIPHLVFLDENGKVLSDRGVMLVSEYGAEGYPFTPERVKEIKEQEEEARRNQSLRSILESPSRDFVITANGNKALVTNLEGKTVGLYFSLSSFKKSSDFTGTLVKTYNELKAKEENFEIIMIPLDDDEESFKKELDGVPWLSLPFKDKKCEKLVRYFELSTLPTLVIIGPDGKTLHPNVADAIEEHGANAYPFTPDKFSELEKIEKARLEAQTFESVLVSGDLDFVVGKDGVKIPVSDLVGKYTLLYFSAHWCPPCRAFTPKLVETYHEIKAKHDAFEVIFISSDRDQASYEEYYATMPWLSLPFGDKRKQSLSRVFKVNGIPLLAALGPTGKTITTEARGLIMLHGAEAFPFTDERMAEIEAEYAEMAKGWPNKVKHELHEEHELVLTRSQGYTCDECDKDGKIWAYSCEECNFDLHTECALKESNGKKETETETETEKANEGWICDGEVCYKAP